MKNFLIEMKEMLSARTIQLFIILTLLAAWFFA